MRILIPTVAVFILIESTLWGIEPAILSLPPFRRHPLQGLGPFVSVPGAMYTVR